MKPHSLSKSLRKTSRKGFSILEVLVAVACIGILTALMAAEISDASGAAENAKNMRNAQNLASLYQTAQASGLNFYDPDLATIVANMVVGGTVSDPTSPFDGAYFSLPEMTEDEQLGLQTFLVLDTVGEVIIYNSQAIPTF